MTTRTRQIDELLKTPADLMVSPYKFRHGGAPYLRGFEVGRRKCREAFEASQTLDGVLPISKAPSGIPANEAKLFIEGHNSIIEQACKLLDQEMESYDPTT